MNPFATFAYDPIDISNVTFETQRKDEVVHLMLRRSAITNLPWIVLSTSALIIPSSLLTFLNSLPSEFSSLTLHNIFSPTEITLISFLYILTVLYFAFIHFSSWFYNIVIVTNIRIVDVNFKAPFHTQTTQAQLQEIQDIRYTQGGLWGIIFNFGNLFIQTAGSAQNIHLKLIPNPNVVQERIVQLLPQQ